MLLPGVVSTCSDGVRSSAEGGVDCGGVCELPCDGVSSATWTARYRIPLMTSWIGAGLACIVVAALVAYRRLRRRSVMGAERSAVDQPAAVTRGSGASGRATDTDRTRSRPGPGKRIAVKPWIDGSDASASASLSDRPRVRAASSVSVSTASVIPVTSPSAAVQASQATARRGVMDSGSVSVRGRVDAQSYRHPLAAASTDVASVSPASGAHRRRSRLADSASGRLVTAMPISPQAVAGDSWQCTDGSVSGSPRRGRTRGRRSGGARHRDMPADTASPSQVNLNRKVGSPRRGDRVSW